MTSASLFSAKTSQPRRSMLRGFAAGVRPSSAASTAVTAFGVNLLELGQVLHGRGVRGRGDHRHQYLTLGSSTAYPMSASRFPTIVATAVTTVIPSSTW